MGGCPKIVSDEELVKCFRNGMTPMQICQATGTSYGTTQKLRWDKLAKKAGIVINRRPAADKDAIEKINEYMAGEGRKHFSLTNGVMLIGSDPHYWPGLISTAHKAFVKFCADMRPTCVIMNGDGIDGGSISRHPRIGWDKRPRVEDELEASDARLGEIEAAARTKNLYWPLGNHDARFETFLAARVPEYEGVKGFKLKDHFPSWVPCWSVHVNDDVVVKHRSKGGINAARNNTLNAGKTIITGHLHSMKVTPLSDYNGTRYGVDTGTLAAPYGPQFSDYTEDGVCDWRAGFIVLTFWKGTLLWPEICHVMDENVGLCQFRGTTFKV